MKMKKRKINLAIIMVLIIAMMLPQSVFAAYKEKYDHKVIDLTVGKYVNAVSYTSKYDEDTDTSTDTFYMYRLTVPSNAFICIVCGSAANSLSLYSSYKKGKDIDESKSIVDFAGQKKYYQVLSKGTYYIHVESSVKFKYHYYTINDRNNYSRSTAANLAAGTRTTAMFHFGRENSKYYRIVLKQSRPIIVNLERRDGEDGIGFSVLNSLGKRIAQTVSTQSTIITNALPAGTYYIRVDREDELEDDDHYTDRLASLTWN
jgi:hypothetical protein